MSKNTIGLKEKIKKASNTEDIHRLLVEGKSYTEASLETQRKWQREARRRTQALQAPAPVKKASSKTL